MDAMGVVKVDVRMTFKLGVEFGSCLIGGFLQRLDSEAFSIAFLHGRNRVVSGYS